MKRTFGILAALLLSCGAAHAQSSLRVLDYGAEPRATIRYSFKAGNSQRARMEMTMNGSSEIDGQKSPRMNLPTTTSIMELRVTEVAPDGSARIEFDTRSAEAPVDQAGGAAAQAALSHTLAGLTKLSGWYRTDTRGKVSDTSVSLPEDFMSPGGMQAMSQLMGSSTETLQQFPEEAVGVGARWVVVQSRELAGNTITLSQEFTVKARSGNHVELAIRNSEPAISGPGIQVTAGGLGSLSGGTGTLAIDLDKLVPRMTLETNSSNTSTLSMQGETRTMKVNMQMRMSLVPEG